MHSVTVGRLNESLKGLSATTHLASDRPLPKDEKIRTGNPLFGEACMYPWNTVRNDGISFCISCDEAVFFDSVTIRLGEKTELTEIIVKEECGNILSSYHAESGKTVTEREVSLTVDRITKTFTLALISDFSDVEVLSIELYGMTLPENGALPVFPTPKEALYGKTAFPVSHFDTFTGESADELRAAEILKEKLDRLFGVRITRTDTPTERSIRFLTDPSVPKDGYRLRVSECGATVTASNLRGLVMGEETLLKLYGKNGIRTAEISDAPFLPLRGVHLYLPAKSAMAFTHRLVRDLISPMGYNLIIFEVATGMEYKSHPEINEAFRAAKEKIREGLWPAFPHGSVAEGTSLSHDDIRALVKDVRSFGIEVVPEVQSLGHVPYLTLAHPEIAETEEKSEDGVIDTRAEDARPDRFYPHCYCPSNDRSYEILFDILDEVIEVFRPKEYLHMGHDEVYYMGLCPKCKTKSHAELYASDINRIHAHLKEKGYKMMIWSDMLQPVTKYQTPAAVDLVPKDILCLDFIWYFHLTKDIETNLLDKGFKVGIGNLYSSHFPRYESRIRQSGMVGGQISTWSATKEAALTKEGKFYDLFYTAQMLWSESYTAHCRNSYDRLIRKKMPTLRDALRGTHSPSRDANAVFETLFEGHAHAADGDVIEISGNQVYRSIRFTQTMTRPVFRMPWKPCELVASYRLTYTDGTEEEIPVTAGGNIGYVHRRQNEPIPHKLYRHNGYTATYESDSITSRAPNGTVHTEYCLEHILPEGKILSSVTLWEDETVAAGIVLCHLEGVR